jgi:hypothetical protein
MTALACGGSSSSADAGSGADGGGGADTGAADGGGNDGAPDDAAPPLGCLDGGACGKNELCCALVGASGYGQCYPKACLACCQ